MVLETNKYFKQRGFFSSHPNSQSVTRSIGKEEKRDKRYIYAKAESFHSSEKLRKTSSISIPACFTR